MLPWQGLIHTKQKSSITGANNMTRDEVSQAILKYIKVANKHPKKDREHLICDALAGLTHARMSFDKQSQENPVLFGLFHVPYVAQENLCHHLDNNSDIYVLPMDTPNNYELICELFASSVFFNRLAKHDAEYATYWQKQPILKGNKYHIQDDFNLLPEYAKSIFTNGLELLIYQTIRVDYGVKLFEKLFEYILAKPKIIPDIPGIIRELTPNKLKKFSSELWMLNTIYNYPKFPLNLVVDAMIGLIMSKRVSLTLDGDIYLQYAGNN